MTGAPNSPGPWSAVDLDRLRPILHRYCARMVGSVLDGEDIVQEAFLRALQTAAPEQPIENPEGWLFRVAHHLALDHLRRRARALAREQETDMDLVADPTDELARRAASAASLTAFMGMPASQRSVVILFDVLEYSADEIAALLGTSVPGVKSTLQRGRNRLRSQAAQVRASEKVVNLPPAEQRLLRRYVDLFNARDFDTLRTLLTADVQLDLVNRLRRQGPAVGEYLSRYEQTRGWRAWPGVVEGRAAVLMQQQERVDDIPDYFIVLDWRGEQVSTIRDFLFARYAIEGAEPETLFATPAVDDEPARTDAQPET